MHKFRTKLFITALVTALVLGSVLADVANAQALDGADVQTETAETALVDEPMALAEGETLAVNKTNFPDDGFRAYLLETFDEDGNGYINPSEVTSIYLSKKGVNSLKGIEYFTNLVELECAGNALTTLDVSHNPKLNWLNCGDNNLTSIDVSHNPELEFFMCNDNRLTSLDVSNNPEIYWLNCSFNQLSTLNMGRKTGFYDGSGYVLYLECNDNNLTSLDLSQTSNLSQLTIDYDKIKELDLSNTNFNVEKGGYCHLELHFQELPESGSITLSKLKGYTTSGNPVTVSFSDPRYEAYGELELWHDGSMYRYYKVEADVNNASIAIWANSVTKNQPAETTPGTSDSNNAGSGNGGGNAASGNTEASITIGSQTITDSTLSAFAASTIVSSTVNTTISKVSMQTAQSVVDQVKALIGPNATIVTIVDLSVPEGTGEAIYSLGCDVVAGQNVTILHQKKDGSWEKIKPMKVSNGVVIFTLSSYSPIAVVVNNSSDTAGTAGTIAPKTQDIVLLIAGIAIVCLTGAAAFGRKAKLS